MVQELKAVKNVIPVGGNEVRAVEDGMKVYGLLVPKFAEDKDHIVIVNAALTVYIRN